MRTKTTATGSGMAIKPVPSPSQMNDFSEAEKKIIANLVTNGIDYLVTYINNRSNPDGTNPIFGGLSLGSYSSSMRLIEESISQITEIMRRSGWHFSSYRVCGADSYYYDFCIKSNNVLELEEALNKARRLKRTRFLTTAGLFSINFGLLSIFLIALTK